MTDRTQWTFADVWEAAAERFPDEPALVHDGRVLTHRAFDERADGVAAALVGAGLDRQAKVAQYLYNGPEYLESVFACFKAGLVPVNTNYRYTGDELTYLWDNADVEAVVFHGDLVDRCEEVRARAPRVRLWLWVDAGPEHGVCPEWATPYEDAAGQRPGRFTAPWGRSGDDLLLIYTGGTTGHPKGVMWPQDTILRMLEELNGRDPSAFADSAERAASLARPGPRVLPAAPLMHATALWFALPALGLGGSVVTTSKRHFDAAELLDVIAAEGVKGVCVVGDAFARPLADALDAAPDRWDLSGLRVLFSSGVMFSAATKERLLAHAPRLIIVDSLGSSESGSLGRSVTEGSAGGATASFKVGDRTRVVDDEGHDVVPGSGQRGRLAVSGRIPVGYYGDPVKTAETFLDLDGTVHVVAGDWAEVEADGTVRLLGRGSVCINTGGEKVFPEEVEEALKELPGISDAVVVGLPDERFGQVVVGLVEGPGGATVDLDEDAVREHLRRSLAGYKVPRRVLAHSIGRAANGKADYPRLTSEASALAAGGR